MVSIIKLRVFFTIAILSLLPFFSAKASTTLPEETSDTPTLPYQVILGSTKDNQTQCSNCGNNGKTLLVQGAGDIRQYNFFIDNPYYIFLAKKGHESCPYTSWVAIKKTHAAPFADIFSVGCYPLKDFRSNYDQETTKITFYFSNGIREIIEFSNK